MSRACRHILEAAQLRSSGRTLAVMRITPF
jgi:hypothetical protein